MGAWNRLRDCWLWRSQSGAVTVESAFGIAALIAVTIGLVQILATALMYLQIVGIAHEAVRIAAASGSVELRVGQAVDFVESLDSRLEINVDVRGTHVEVKVSKELPFALAGLPKEISASVEGLRVDQVLW
jgi:Flp pilus assembly protein TadG